VISLFIGASFRNAIPDDFLVVPEIVVANWREGQRLFGRPERVY
jgi:hypothetical protein